MNSDEKIIPLWLMVYNQDPTQTYLFTSKDKVFASIEGLIRSVAPDDAADKFVELALDTLNSTWGAPLIPMQFRDTLLFVHRLEIDRHNPIHQALTKCRNALEDVGYGAAQQEAIDLVDGLLVDPIALGR